MEAQAKVSKGIVSLDGVEIGYVDKSEDLGWAAFYMKEDVPFWYSTRKQAVASLVSLYKWVQDNPEEYSKCEKNPS